MNLEREKIDKPLLSTRIMTGKAKTTPSVNDAPTDAATKAEGSSGESTLVKSMISSLYIIGFLNFLYKAAVEAFDIRLYAIKEYGLVIHEFDPYFNYRAAEVSSPKKTSRMAIEYRIHDHSVMCSYVSSDLMVNPILFVSFFSICGQMVLRNFSSGSITCLGIRWDDPLVPQFILECNLPASGSKGLSFQTGQSMIFVAMFLFGLEFWRLWPRRHSATPRFHRLEMMQRARVC